jgi:exodeoxyribonuclease V gamma subunit
MEAAAPFDLPQVQGFLQLLKLSESRWTVEEILELFAIPAFRNKQRIQEEELQTLETWIRKSGILWGQTSQHRDEILKGQHCRTGMVEKSEVGTWEKGEEQLLESLIFDNEGVRIESTQAELLGKLLNVLDSLRQDLKMLQEERGLKEWVCYLQCLFEAYFEEGGEESLFSHLTAFDIGLEAKFPFTTILFHLEESTYF